MLISVTVVVGPKAVLTDVISCKQEVASHLRNTSVAVCVEEWHLNLSIGNVGEGGGWRLTVSTETEVWLQPLLHKRGCSCFRDQEPIKDMDLVTGNSTKTFSKDSLPEMQY